MCGGWQKYLSWEIDHLLKTGDLKARILKQPYLNWIMARYESVAVPAA
jgi:hypothetical protein